MQGQSKVPKYNQPPDKKLGVAIAAMLDVGVLAGANLRSYCLGAASWT